MVDSSASVYESAALALDASHGPLLYADFKAPRDVTEQDVQALLDMSDQFLSGSRPFLPLIHLRKGTGIISSQPRRMFADWIESRAAELGRDDVCAVIVVPEAIFRAVLRVVYRFRAAPMRTITVSDIDGAADAALSELARMAQPATPACKSFLATISESRTVSRAARG